MPAPNASCHTAGIALNEQFDAYSAFTSGGLTDHRPTAAWNKTAGASGRRWHLDDVTVLQTRHHGLEMRRAAASARQSSQDFFALVWYIDGTYQGHYGGTAFKNHRDEVFFNDLRQPVDARSSGAVDILSVTIPYELLDYIPGKTKTVVGHTFTGARNRLVQRNLLQLIEDLPTVSRAEAVALGRAFAGLVRGLLSARPSSDEAWNDFAQARSSAIRTFVDENIARGPLTIGRICAAVGASRATVYREFADEGGLQHYVTGRRVANALAELAVSTPRRGRVGEVARRWGFSDQGHFNRLSRRHAGVAPSDVLGSAAGNGGAEGSFMVSHSSEKDSKLP